MARLGSILGPHCRADKDKEFKWARAALVSVKATMRWAWDACERAEKIAGRGVGVGSAWAAGRAGLVTPAKKRSAMIHMLWLIGHGGKELLVPKVGRWLMKMPHGYTLVGEGRAGVKIEPPRGQVALRADNPYAGDHFEESQPAPSGPKLDAHDTEGVLALCDQARRAARPERDRVISQIFAFRLDR